MGKLAERLADERRSGVYRVEVTDALVEAAAIDGFPIMYVRLDGVACCDLHALCARALAPGIEANWAALAQALADPRWSPGPGHVLIFSGFEALLRREDDALAPLLTALQAAATQRRVQGLKFFATLLDPTRMLSLDPLYDRRRHSLTTIARVTNEGAAP